MTGRGSGSLLTSDSDSLDQWLQEEPLIFLYQGKTCNQGESNLNRWREATRDAIKSFCWSKPYPIYVRQSDPKRFVVECPSTMKKKVKKITMGDGEGGAADLTKEREGEGHFACTTNEEVAGQTNEEMNEEIAGQTNASDNFAAVMNKCTL